jgi:hypothetical protein
MIFFSQSFNRFDIDLSGIGPVCHIAMKPESSSLFYANTTGPDLFPES